MSQASYRDKHEFPEKHGVKRLCTVKKRAENCAILAVCLSSATVGSGELSERCGARHATDASRK